MKDNKAIELKINPDLTLRSLKPEDINSLVKYANNRSIWLNLMDGFPYPYTKKDAKKWISYCLTKSTNIHLAIIYKNELVGAIGAEFKEDIYRYNAELGYWIGEPFWSKGILSRVIEKLTPFLFDSYKINRIYGHVYPDNKGSKKVLLRNGFKKEGLLRKAAFKDGFFIDIEIFSRLKED